MSLLVLRFGGGRGFSAFDFLGFAAGEDCC
jgi:hypothetical protein